MRITNAHKEKIVNALTAPQEKTYAEQAQKLRHMAYKKARFTIPGVILGAYENHREFFNPTTGVRAKDSFQRIDFPKGLSLPGPARHPDVSTIARDIAQLQEENYALRRKVRVALAPFTTYKKLKEGWPEAAEVLPDPKKAVTALVDLEQVNKIRAMLNQKTKA